MTSVVNKYELNFIYKNPEYAYFSDDIKYKINRVCLEIALLEKEINEFTIMYNTLPETLNNLVNLLHEEIEILISQGSDSS